MPSTPTYSLPYQTLSDAPDGPNLGEDLALAVEAALSAQVALLAARLTLLENMTAVRMRQTSVQSIANNTWTGITCTAEDLDDDPVGGASHSTSSNTSRITPAYAGWYLYGGAVAFATAAAVSQRGAAMAVNGTLKDGTAVLLPSALAANITIVPTRPDIVFLNGTTDYVELMGYQNAGAGLNTFATAENQSGFFICRIRNAA